MQNEVIKQLIEQQLPDSVREIEGDGTHFEVLVVSDQFAGRNQVQRHQLVYQALGEKMGAEIHALSIRTFTPEEWEQKRAFKVIGSGDV